jgi:hypothetical protein
MNRKSKRAKDSNTRRAVRAIAKAAGQTEPTAEEKDPAFLALQIRSLHETISQFVKIQQQNTEGIRKAFSMTDVHQQILQRITRDLTFALVEVRRLFVDGDVTAAKGDLDPLKIHPDGTLDMHAYYQEYRELGVAAGPEHADLALVIWSQGNSPEESLDRAKLEKVKQATSAEPVKDPDYEEVYFGGEHGENHHEQVEAAAQANG